MAQLLSNLPIGAKVKFGTYNDEPLSWLLASTNGTMILEHIIDNKAFDAAEPEWEYGYAYYGESNIRQWLNSDKQVWYVPAHGKDKPPYYENTPGFLYSFSLNEKNALQTVTINTKVLAGGGNATYTINDKVFLPSVQDVSTKSYNFSESKLLPLFNNSSYLIATAGGTTKWHWWLRTPSVSSATYILAVNEKGTIYEELPYQVGWGVRPCIELSPQLKVSDTTDGDGHYTIIYNTAPLSPTTIGIPTIYGGKSNAISWSSASDLDGDSVAYTLECSLNGGEYSQIYSGTSTVYAHLVPFGTISVAYRVKATDPSGASSAYTTSNTVNVINNNAPVISGADANLGVKSSGFTGTYKVTDANNNTVTVTESIDGVQIRSLIATLGQDITYGITGNTWLSLPNGSHTLTIRATDGIDSTVRTYTFTKLVETLVIQNSTPWVSTTMPSRIMLVITRNIPSESTFKVEVCNNGYDTTPVWEDCTDAVKSGLVHVFTNKVKTSGTWGVLVRVTVSRNGATGACYVSAIGGNFE